MDLTRKILSLEASKNIDLDYNYHYALMKEIYNAITIINEDFAQKLHDTGYTIENKKYKLFTSHLYIDNPIYKDESISIKKGTRCKLIISGAKEVVNYISLGFMEKETLNLLGNQFNIVSLENDKRIKFDTVSLYKVANPIVATRQDENKNIVYVSPYEENFYKIIAHNLKRKYQIIYGKEYEGDLYFDIENTLNIKKKLISKIKDKFFIIGYNGFEIFIEADRDMQKVAYYCGLGGYNSLGMGAINHIMSRGV